MKHLLITLAVCASSLAKDVSNKEDGANGVDKVERKESVPYAITDLADARFPYHVYMTPELYADCNVAWQHGYHFKGIYSIERSEVDQQANTSFKRWTWVICNNTVERPSTVILQRIHGVENFSRPMHDYIAGFGSVKTDYWLGLHKIRQLTLEGKNKLMITMRDFYNKEKKMVYEGFRLGEAPDYRLSIDQLTAGDVPDDLIYHVGRPFRAPGNPDRREFDGSSCAEMLNTGWWYLEAEHCAYTLLTGELRRDNSHNGDLCQYRRPYSVCDAVYWMDWTGFQPIKSIFVELF